jgi:hypothetical protein
LASAWRRKDPCSRNKKGAISRPLKVPRGCRVQGFRATRFLFYRISPRPSQSRTRQGFYRNWGGACCDLRGCRCRHPTPSLFGTRAFARVVPPRSRCLVRPLYWRASLGHVSNRCAMSGPAGEPSCSWCEIRTPAASNLLETKRVTNLFQESCCQPAL